MSCCSLTYVLGALFVILPTLYKVYIKYVLLACRNNNKVSLVGKTVLVTGANTGMGYATALEFAKRGARLIVACRNESKGTEAVDRIKKLTQNKDVELKLLDLSSVNSIRKFAKDILDNEKRLDILVNNAGALFHSEKLTEDGFQVEMLVNYFGPSLLTLLLVDLLTKSPLSRIISVSSKGAKYSNLTPETINTYSGHFNAYSNSKLGIILFTQELAKKLKHKNVSVFSVHPGLVYNDTIHREFNFLLQPIIKIVTRIIFVSPDEGCQTALYTALEPGIEHLTGNHFEGFNVVTYSNARDPTLAKQIWDATMTLIKFDDKHI